MLTTLQKHKIQIKVQEQNTILLNILADEYNHLVRDMPRQYKRFGWHPIMRHQCRKGWKSLDRDTRRYTYAEICKEQERRKSNG